MGQNSQNPAESAPQERISSQQLSVYLASFPDAIVVWDREGKIRFLNAAACTLFEVQASDALVGTPAQQFFQRYVWSDEQQRPFFFAPWLLDPASVQEETVPRSYEQILVLGLPSRRTVCLELRCSLVLDADQLRLGIISVFHETTPRCQRALHIQRVYEALVALDEAIESIPEQSYLVCSDETFLFSAPVILVEQQLVDVIRQTLACWRVSLSAFSSPSLHISYVVGSGFTAEEEQRLWKLGKRFLFTDFVDETVLARLQAHQEVVITTDRIRIPTGFPPGFGVATLLAIPLFLDQNLTGLLLVHKQGWEYEYTQEEIDLVKAVAAQAQLLIECLSCLCEPGGKQARELVLPEADRLSKDFLNLASHELRTPLTGIKGNLQLAQRRLERLRRDLSQQSERTSEQLEQTWRSLEAAEQSVWLQERMIQDMIDDARLQADQLDLAFSPCDLLVLLKQAVAKQQASVPEQVIGLDILTSESTIPLLADSGRITQVLTIYLATALASSPTARPVTVRVQEEGHVVRVSVHDEGPGISPEEQRCLWERLYRGKGSSVQQELDLSGGLRFYLCRALIERHHGTVGVESTPGQGTTFWLTLPIARPVEGPALR